MYGVVQRWLRVIVILFAVPAAAQTTLQLTFHLNVNYLFGNPENYYWCSGTVAPRAALP